MTGDVLKRLKLLKKGKLRSMIMGSLASYLKKPAWYLYLKILMHFRYEAISVGRFDDGSGEAETLQQQLMKLKSEISTASTTIKTAEMKMKHDSQELKKAESELKKYEKDNSKDTENLQT